MDDDPSSSVDIVATAADDLRGIWRIARHRHLERVRAHLVGHGHRTPSPATTDQLLSFAGVGVLSTLSYLLLFAAGWSALGPWAANAAALAFCTLVNTTLHRSLARRSPAGSAREPTRPSFVIVVAVLYAVSLAVTTAAIAVGRRAHPPHADGRRTRGNPGLLRRIAPPVLAAARMGLSPGRAGDPARGHRPDDRPHRRAGGGVAARPRARTRRHGARGGPLASDRGNWARGTLPPPPASRRLLRPRRGWWSSAVGIVMAVIYPKLRVGQVFGSVWDGRWYLTIAQHGYPHHLVNEGDGSRWAFFPAFPGAVRALAEVTRLSLPDAAVVAAFVFGLTSALAIWLAVREVFGARLADRAVLLYVFCPTAYVLSLAYTEGLFLTAGGDVPLRAVTPLLDHRGTVRLRCRADPQHRHRRRRSSSLSRHSLRPGGGARCVPPWRRPSRRSGLSRSWPTAGRWSALPWRS